MEPFVINYIKSNPLLYNYLRENSSVYKDLTRNPNNIQEIEKLAKKYFKQTPEDKIQKLSENINLIVSLMDVLK